MTCLGHWRLKGVAEPVEIFEFHAAEASPGSLADAAKATRLGESQKLQIAARLLDVVDEAIDDGDVRGAASLLSKAIDVSRTARDAPEVDGRVLVSVPPGHPTPVRAGDFVEVEITGIKGYDLLAKVTR